MHLFAFGTPTFLAISETVTGSSPEITLISTPESINHFIFASASSFMWSERTRTPMISHPSGTLPFFIAFLNEGDEVQFNYIK